MKCALIIAEKIRQIMFSPETEMEKAVIKLLSDPDQEMSVDFKTGTLFSPSTIPPSAHGYIVAECRGEYLRAFEEANALMIVLRPKEATISKETAQIIQGESDD